MRGYVESLLSKQASIGVWGIGYIGCSTMAYYAEAGIKCIGVDVDASRVDTLNRGEIPVPGLEAWFDFETEPLISKRLMRATTDTAEVLNQKVPVHFICVPTERDGRPELSILETVIDQIAAAIKNDSTFSPLVVIESTMTPGTTDKLVIPLFQSHGLIVGQDLLLGVAPRRDWFVAKGQSLRNLDRICGGFDEESSEETLSVLGIVCQTLHQASSYKVSEIVKCVENAFRHMEITLANQLSLAYPDHDIRELLRLVGTKWNVGTYHPSFGTGGYCIPLSSQYVLEGAQAPQELTLLAETLQTDTAIRGRVAESVISRGCKRVGVLGLSYRGNLKVSILSPTIGIVKALLDRKIEVKVCDPYYGDEEIRHQTGAFTFSFPSDIQEFDALLITADHQEFASEESREALLNLPIKPLILDNYGLWSDWKLREHGFEYYQAGEANWLGNLKVPSVI